MTVSDKSIPKESGFSLPTIFVIFGITGDLMQSKLLPGLFNLYRKGLLTQKFEVIGFSRKDYSDIELRRYLKSLMMENKFKKKDLWGKFLSNFSYIQGNFNEAGTYRRLANVLGRVDGQWRTCSNKLFYLAVPPQFYRTILGNLHNSELTDPCCPEEGWTRVILEKPFGNNLKNAQKLDAMLGKLFREEQIYRVDHYLGKETVRNILAFRFSNSFLAPAWNNKYIEKIEIKLLEKKHVKSRGEYYDAVGALRDVGQNHLLQLLAVFTMDNPMDFSAENIRRKRNSVLSRLKILNRQQIRTSTFRSQYKGFKNEEGVSSGSKTETYFKVKASIDDPRWTGVSLYLESGKALSASQMEVIVTFKHQEPCLCPPGNHYQNVLRYRIQPQERIITEFLVKKPGYENILQEQDFEFDYRDVYEKEEFIEAYEKLLLDMINGDQTLFVSTEEIMHEWRFVEPILQEWKRGNPPLFSYKPGQKVDCQLPAKKQAEMTKHIGVIGLGKMGGNVALQLLEKRWKVVGYNRSPEKTDQIAKRGLDPAYEIKGLINKLPHPRVVFIMLPAGDAVDATIFEKDGLISYLSKGDIIIDAGNSFYKDTIRRGKRLARHGIEFVDVGVSGGPSGARRGACLMVGGTKKLYDTLLPLYLDISVSHGTEFFEGLGAGHFVKMVHNGIEYGMMQAIAEGFSVLKKSRFKPNLRRVADIYNHASVIESRLMGWLADGFELYGEGLEKISGTVAHTGEGEWTIKTAEELKVPVDVIRDSLEFRKKSRKNPSFIGRVVSVIRGQFGGHQVLRLTGSRLT